MANCIGTVIQAQNHIRQGEYEKAEEAIAATFQQSKSVRAHYFTAKDPHRPPLDVTLLLFDILGMDQLQCVDQLKTSVAKTCRVYLDMTYIAFKCEKRVLSQGIQIRILTVLKKVMETVRPTEVYLDFVLQYCLSTATDFNRDLSCLSNYKYSAISCENKEDFMSRIEFCINGNPKIATLSCYLAVTSSGLTEDEYDVQPWAHYVRAWNLYYDHILGGIGFSTNYQFLHQFYESVDNLSSMTGGRYMQWTQLAFCVLETLISALDKTDEHITKNAIIDITADVSKPCLKHFVNYGLDDNRSSTAWKVRYRVIEYLTTKKSIVGVFPIIAGKRRQYEHPEVCKLVTQYVSRCDLPNAIKAMFREKLDIRPMKEEAEKFERTLGDLSEKKYLKQAREMNMALVANEEMQRAFDKALS